MENVAEGAMPGPTGQTSELPNPTETRRPSNWCGPNLTSITARISGAALRLEIRAPLFFGPRLVSDWSPDTLESYIEKRLTTHLKARVKAHLRHVWLVPPNGPTRSLQLAADRQPELVQRRPHTVGVDAPALTQGKRPPRLGSIPTYFESAVRHRPLSTPRDSVENYVIRASAAPVVAVYAFQLHAAPAPGTRFGVEFPGVPVVDRWQPGKAKVKAYRWNPTVHPKVKVVISNPV